MTKDEILAELAKLKEHAKALDLELFAVLQTQQALKLETITADSAWNAADEWLAYACEQLDCDHDDYEVVLAVVQQ